VGTFGTLQSSSHSTQVTRRNDGRIQPAHHGYEPSQGVSPPLWTFELSGSGRTASEMSGNEGEGIWSGTEYLLDVLAVVRSRMSWTWQSMPSGNWA